MARYKFGDVIRTQDGRRTLLVIDPDSACSSAFLGHTKTEEWFTAVVLLGERPGNTIRNAWYGYVGDDGRYELVSE